MTFRRGISVLLVGLFLAGAASADPGAEAWVKDQRTQLLGALKKGGSAKTDPKVAAIVDNMLDYPTLCEDSLGKEWSRRTAEERKQFCELLDALVRRTYRRNLDKTLVDYKVIYKDVVVVKKGVRVPTVVKNQKKRREEPTQIEYLVHKVNGQWQIRDVTTEGSSMVRNYRRQFRKIIKKHGFPELLKRMQKKLDEPDNAESTVK